MSKESAMAVLTGNPVPPPQISTPNGATPPQLPSETLKSDPFSKLARKEEQILREKQTLKSEREAFQKDRDQVLEAKKKYDEYLVKKQTDPIEAMKMLGFSETDIFNYIANQTPAELSPEEKAIQAAEKAADARLKAFEDAQVKKQQEAQSQINKELLQGFRNDIKKTIDSNKDHLEYCSYYGKEAENLAYEISTQVVTRSKGTDFVDAKEALQMAEDYYEERDKEMARLKKRQSQVSTFAKASPPVSTERTRTLSNGPVSEAPKPAITKTRTLHNGATSTVASTRQTRTETRDQKRDRLIEALKNGVKL